ncbi:MAG: anti-sigma factor antagonist [Cryomorphaceae bacterium]|nr:MAG: anti-sigma factor antagonist [Cryomorphaceae bacterium]
MNFEVKNEEKHAMVQSHVEKLDSMNAPDLKSELVMLNKNGVRNIVLNLEKTRYCDSSGLSAILVGNRLCKNANGTFVVTGLQSTVQKMITISQLDSVLNITPTQSEAVDLIMMEEVERELGDD